MNPTINKYPPAKFAGESVKLACEHVSDLVRLQIRQGAHLDNKASVLFAIASGVAAITAPLVLRELQGHESTPALAILVWLAGLSAILYLHSAYWFLRSYKLRMYVIATEPNIAVRVAQKPEIEAYALICAETERCFDHNHAINRDKARNISRLTSAAIAQTGYTVGHALVVALYSLA